MQAAMGGQCTKLVCAELNCVSVPSVPESDTSGGTVWTAR